jgi:hypothetical protein
MRLAALVLLIAALAGGSACAARDGRAEHAAGSVQRESAPVSRYREMTWAEYYGAVTDRVWKRGGTVVWISPPNVRKAKRPPPHGAAP